MGLEYLDPHNVSLESGESSCRGLGCRDCRESGNVSGLSERQRSWINSDLKVGLRLIASGERPILQCVVSGFRRLVVGTCFFVHVDSEM